MNQCRWCDMFHGPTCYLVKAIEFFEDGATIKRVEFKSSADYPQQVVSIPTVFGAATAKVDVAAGSHSTYFEAYKRAAALNDAIARSVPVES